MKIKVFLISAISCFALYYIIHYTISLKNDNNRLKNNQEILILEKDSIAAQKQFYKVSDSLNAIQVKELTLTNNEYKQYRAKDAAIISKLKADKSENIIKTKTEIQTEIITQIDTVYIDSTKHFSYSDNWAKINGTIYNDTVKLNISNNEELIIVESIQRKKFLFIKLPVKLFGYKHRQIDIISKNPNTRILSSEFITFK